MSTLTAAQIPVQMVGYQYDGGGNILGYANRAIPKEQYQSTFDFDYDAANRLGGFHMSASKGSGGGLRSMSATGANTLDPGHRLKSRDLTITGDGESSFARHWTYRYGTDRTQGPLNAPRSIAFTIGDSEARETLFGYDDVGRMSRLGSGTVGEDGSPSLEDRRRTVDGVALRPRDVLGCRRQVDPRAWGQGWRHTGQ